MLFQNMTVEEMHQQLPVWIITLARATTRRQHMLKQIEAAGMVVRCCNCHMQLAAGVREQRPWSPGS
jgi:hypothetical protein